MNEIFRYKINNIKKSHHVVILDIVPEKGDIFDFKSGQFIMLTLYDEKGAVWQEHPFSICSSPLNKKYLQLAIKVYGNFTQKVATLKKNDRIGISGPFGIFTFDETKMKDIVFIAGGIGITPFISIIRYIFQKKFPNKLKLLYSNKSKKDITFFRELKSISRKDKNIKLIFTLTRKIPYFWRNERGRINEMMLKKYCPSFENKYFFLCGPLDFMESITKQLIKNGVPENHIKTERFK